MTPLFRIVKEIEERAVRGGGDFPKKWEASAEDLRDAAYQIAEREDGEYVHTRTREGIDAIVLLDPDGESVPDGLMVRGVPVYIKSRG